MWLKLSPSTRIYHRPEQSELATIICLQCALSLWFFSTSSRVSATSFIIIDSNKTSWNIEPVIITYTTRESGAQLSSWNSQHRPSTLHTYSCFVWSTAYYIWIQDITNSIPITVISDDPSSNTCILGFKMSTFDIFSTYLGAYLHPADNHCQYII